MLDATAHIKLMISSFQLTNGHHNPSSEALTPLNAHRLQQLADTDAGASADLNGSLPILRRLHRLSAVGTKYRQVGS